MLFTKDQNIRRDVSDFITLSLSDAAAGYQIVKLTLNRQVSVELPYLVLRVNTGWARRERDRSVVRRIPRNRGTEDIHGLGHHMTGILTLFCQGNWQSVWMCLTPLVFYQ